MKKNKKAEKKYIRITSKMVVFAVLLLWISSVGGVWLMAKKTSPTTNKKDNSFQLLNPRLKTSDFDTPEDRNARMFATLVSLKDQMLGSLGNNKDNAAFYIEDLNSGSWVGWKERDPFVAASLMKVPVAIGVMKKVDNGEWTLDTTFPIEARFKDKRFGDLWKVSDGTQMSIRDLLNEMLQKSDNTALGVLIDKLTTEERDNIFYHIGVENPEGDIKEVGGRDVIKLTAKDDASMFRALYNSTYLKRISSDYILKTLTQTEFSSTLPKELQENVKVAHKIGNFYNPDPSRPKQYHDCGIAYIPEHPYLYCIMTQNLDATPAEEVITSINNIVYAYFASKGKK